MQCEVMRELQKLWCSFRGRLNKAKKQGLASSDLGGLCVRVSSPSLAGNFLLICAKPPHLHGRPPPPTPRSACGCSCPRGALDAICGLAEAHVAWSPPLVLLQLVLAVSVAAACPAHPFPSGFVSELSSSYLCVCRMNGHSMQDEWAQYAG
jgi:hypothetical protein